MKPRKQKIRDGVAVGSMALLSASLSQADVETPMPSFDDGLISQPIAALDKLTVSSDSISEGPSIQFPVESEVNWTKAIARRFAELALKRARLEATKPDNIEFAELQKARRRQFSNSPDQILDEWRQEKLRRELLESTLKEMSNSLSPRIRRGSGPSGSIKEYNVREKALDYLIEDFDYRCVLYASRREQRRQTSHGR